MKRLCAKNKCELVIVPLNLANKFQSSINQQRNLSQASSTHGMLIELENKDQTPK